MSILPDDTITTRNDFASALQTNDNLLVLKFGAEWCGPCKTIAPLVNQCIEKLDKRIQVAFIDVDEAFDVYAYLKSKKVVAAIPTLLAYKAGSTGLAPDLIVVGADTTSVEHFFAKCNKLCTVK